MVCGMGDALELLLVVDLIVESVNLLHECGYGIEYVLVCLSRHETGSSS